MEHQKTLSQMLFERNSIRNYIPFLSIKFAESSEIYEQKQLNFIMDAHYSLYKSDNRFKFVNPDQLRLEVNGFTFDIKIMSGDVMLSFSKTVPSDDNTSSECVMYTLCAGDMVFMLSKNNSTQRVFSHNLDDTFTECSDPFDGKTLMASDESHDVLCIMWEMLCYFRHSDNIEPCMYVREKLLDILNKMNMGA